MNDSSNYDSDNVLGRLSTAKVITDNWRDVKKHMEPADVLAVRMISVTEKKYDMFTRAFIKFRLAVEQTSYNSLKLCYDKNTITGYYTKLRHLNFDKTVSDYFLSRLDKVVVLRHKDMDSKKAKLIQSQADALYDYSYGKTQLLKKAIERVTHTQHDSTEEAYPMYCSAIVAKMYEFVGIHIGPPNLNSSYIWPSDYILDKNFDVIVKYERNK